MSQLNYFQATLWSVSEITRYIRDLLESDEPLQDAWVQGEVLNYSRPSSGHIYFTLKDSQSSLRCVMWRQIVQSQNYLPANGEAVEIHGNISVYETAGQYQFYADLIRPAGEGLLYQEFLRIKEKLNAEGLFDSQFKRSIPELPQRIGIVTSPTGAALRDVLNTIQRRYPLAEVILSPTQVQGDQAPQQIIAALYKLNSIVHPDVILLVRGGGSIEDLWAFNDEDLARVISSSETPVISGIGHETDFTIADFVSDLRAPTPTAAAELATPNRFDLLSNVQEYRQSLVQIIGSALSEFRFSTERTVQNLRNLSPIGRLRTERQRLDEMLQRNQRDLEHTLQLRRTKLHAYEGRLASANPLSILKRGYATVTLPSGELVSTVDQVHPKREIRVRVSDGSFSSRVEKILDKDREVHRGES